MTIRAAATCRRKIAPSYLENVFPISASASRGRPSRPCVEQLYDELAAHQLTFRPPAYFSDQWGCPEGVPIIGVPFYLADPRLTRIEQFIDGREFYVGVIGNAAPRALPIVEIDFTGFPADRPRIASFDAKWGVEGS